MEPTLDPVISKNPKSSILLHPENHSKKYEKLFIEIDSGQLKLPMFQREFVWDKEQSAKLIDSILKGFPIGTFIIWKTRETLLSYKDIGNHKLPKIPKGDYVQYILDGQQRITSLYAIRKGIRLTKDSREIDYKDIYIDLNANLDENDQIVTAEKTADKSYISIYKLLSSRIIDLINDYKDINLVSQLEDYKSKLTNYDFSTVVINDYPIEIACEIFSRINTSGKALTIFEIMTAKTYDEDRNFNLVEKYESLRDGSNPEEPCLSYAKFETIPEATILRCVAAITVRATRSRDILNINRDKFINNWEIMKASLFSAIDLVRSEFKIPVSQLLPYADILVPITYFFWKTKNKRPNSLQIKLLEQFFYWVGLTWRYSSGTEGKIGEDFNKIDNIIEGIKPTYTASELLVSTDDIAETIFSAGSAYCKTILCLFAFNKPKTFDTNGDVILDNSNLKIASSRNYHHFFPKAYVAKEFRDKESNLIANIVLIDGYNNKHKIGNKPPKKYIKEYEKSNNNIESCLKTHLITDIETYGIYENNYQNFIEQRSKAISLALQKKLNP